MNKYGRSTDSLATFTAGLRSTRSWRCSHSHAPFHIGRPCPGKTRARNPNDPVPVQLSAASWSTDATEHVEQRLSRHLMTAYNLSKAAARTLVAAQKIVPVIDGLDEMDNEPPGCASRAGRALQALNAYQHRRAQS
jgi:hypothetical protein